ncbi:MAG: exodeoxyribonuclease V subunit gamma [Planctomycetes bacterium]|nr:exodeoxyribonuclease V subunit gamma [Planctomycetota bacterium]MBI3833036.1 exodeoxyribonuclease V subunit gamma [Planctomycetota bacterium]
MSVQFIIGRAGSGKTHECVSQIQSEIRRDPIDGSRLILLVPEQASQQMERALLTPLPGAAEQAPTGAHRAEVLSFNRLAFRVLDRVGGPVKQAITDAARTMVLRHLIDQLSGRLSYYARAGRSSGFHERLSQNITELIKEAIDPEALRAAIATSLEDQTIGDEAGAIRKMKLADVATIYAAYLDYLGAERVDPSQHLQLARERMADCPWLRGAKVWVDGFASFSGQELATLTALATLCERMQITVLVDPDLARAGANHSSVGRSRLFGRTLRTFHELVQSLADGGIEVESPLVLVEARRFEKAGPLSTLERVWFADKSPINVKEESGTNSDITNPPSSSSRLGRPQPHGKGGGIEIVELSSRRAEVEYAATRVWEWVTSDESHFRARDIAVIVRDLELYQDELREAFTAKGIPIFMDQRRRVDHHPLVECIRMLIAIAVDDLALDSMRILLKTGLFDLSSDAIDELENYIVAHGIHGFGQWNSGDWNFARDEQFVEPRSAASQRQAVVSEQLNQSRKIVTNSLREWLSAARDTKHRKGDEWSRLPFECIARIGVPRRLAEWTQQALELGRPIEADEHRQVWRDVASFLDDFAFAFRETTLTAEELREVIEAGLSQLTLGLIPPTVDQVLISSIERSRHPDVKAVIVLGLNDGVFPARKSEDSIFNDDDRAALRDRGLRIGLPTRYRIEDEAMLFYIAVTRPSERLVLAYSQLDEKDRPLAPSPFLDAVQKSLPDVTVTRVADSIRSRSMWGVDHFSDLRWRMALEFGERRANVKDNDVASGHWNELYSDSRIRLANDPLARLAFGNLTKAEPARIESELVQRLFGGTLRTSVSQLETYAACPFQYFTKYVLQLRERLAARIEPVDVGQVHHAILEEFVDRLIKKGETISELSDERIMSELSEACARATDRIHVGGALSDARERYRLRRSAEMLGRIIRSQRECWSDGKFRPHGVEVAFGKDESGGLPGLTIDTPKGRRVLLRGVIDRVDLAELSDEILGIVIDYKRTRNKRLDMSSVYHGLSLQLLAYLLVLAEQGKTLAGRPIRPIGAFYLGSSSQYKSVDGPGDSSDGVELAPRRLRGLLSATDFEHIAGGDKSAPAAKHFGFKRSKDGTIGDFDRSDGAEPDMFRDGLSHVRRQLGELADGILDGAMSVYPVRLGNFSPCSWCTMSDVCHFEMGNSDVQFLPNLKRSQVFVKLKGIDGP